MNLKLFLSIFAGRPQKSTGAFLAEAAAGFLDCLPMHGVGVVFRFICREIEAASAKVQARELPDMNTKRVINAFRGYTTP